MKIIYAQEPLEEIKGMVVFLAGPTPRDPEVESWRPKAIDIFKELEFNGTLLLPEMRGGFTDNFEYGNQINWEQEGLEIADDIMFWVPRELKDMPAFITNIEFGYWLAKNPKKIIMGYPLGTPKMDYIGYKCAEVGIKTNATLRDTIQETLRINNE